MVVLNPRILILSSTFGLLNNGLDLYAEPPKSIHALWERIHNEWVQISVLTFKNLISSMPTRVQAVLKQKVVA